MFGKSESHDLSAEAQEFATSCLLASVQAFHLRNSAEIAVEMEDHLCRCSGLHPGILLLPASVESLRAHEREAGLPLS